ncbi:alanine--tRNA ligase [Spiroplasma endosymbiont of Amphibalanus improvisus]|uniref:alanine--tRNA ligase n=1 Tax=Spiroplasma endosymbiont of Amphibalanus improvisus TaxID=3066327 RepID=UPI00313B3E5E
MKKLSSNQIRNMWLTFFKSKEHFILPSASLIPVNDPSLLWINSGVATLKPFFEGVVTPPSKKLVNVQKALRTNDIENVGKTARHHTLFEMMGNFSIGDYFKKDALIYAWEFLTSKKWLELPIEKLYFTIFKEDKETYQILKEQLKISEDHIIHGGKETNFWEIGQGPCGPNAEIFYDRGVKFDPKKQGLELLKKDIENDRYIEIWNIVFSEFNNDGFGNYTKLPQKNIDTGAGLERIVSIVQNTFSNFETDLFLPIIDEVCRLSTNSVQYNFDNNEHPNNIALKVIADHIRAVCFAIADGVFPGNKDQGYVIRKLIRRAIFYANKLGFTEPTLFKLVPTICTILVDYYPDLKKEEKILIETIKNEENSYWKMLTDAMVVLEDMIIKHKKISAKNALTLFESYGCPIDFIVEYATSKKIKVDIKGFEKLLEDTKNLARKSRKKTEGLKIQKDTFLNLNLITDFVGYDINIVDKAKIIFIADSNYNKVSELKNAEGFIILDKTPFYATSGGQRYDDGTISGKNFVAQILNVTKGPNGEHIHQIRVEGKISLSDCVKAEINYAQRQQSMRNHSGTHLLHSAVRVILGNNVKQIGSYNDYKKLRLDISYNGAVTEKQIIQIENLVNQKIQENISSECFYTDYKTAIDKYNALAFFGEKYLEKVRVVKFGDFSCELCGGTHCENTKNIEKFMITNYESKGSGSYRIYALTSNETIQEYLALEIKNRVQKYYPKIQAFYDANQQYLVNSNMKKLLAVTSEKNFRDLTEVDEHLKKLNEEFVSYQKQVVDVIAKNLLKNIEIDLNKNKKLVLQNIINPNPEWLNISKIFSVISDYLINKYSKINICLISPTLSGEFKCLLSSNVANANIGKFIKTQLIKNQDFAFKGGGNNKFGQGVITTNLDHKQLLMILENKFKEVI